MRFARTWDLTSIPDDLLRAEWGRRNSLRRENFSGGRPPVLQPCGFCREEHSTVSLRGHVATCRQEAFLRLLKSGDLLELDPAPRDVRFRIASVTRETITIRSVPKVESGIAHDIPFPATSFRGIDFEHLNAFLIGELKFESSSGFLFRTEDGMRVVNGRPVGAR